MDTPIQLDIDVVSDLTEDLREVLEEYVQCDCDVINPYCTGGCLYARLTKGREVLLEAGD